MAPLIPDDKATKPSIVDEMAREMRLTVGLRDGDNVYDVWACTAAAVVARRLREALEKGAAMPFEREVAKGAMMLMYVSELLTELEGP